MKTVRRGSCYVCGFSCYSVQAKGLHFHSIPTTQAMQQTRDKWLDFLHLPKSSCWPEELWKNISLCSLHFDENIYHPKHKELLRVNLPKGAVPSRNQPTGPGILGDMFSSRSPVSSSSDGQRCESPATTSHQMEIDTFEEESLCTNTEVETSLNTPDTTLRGAISKFHSGSRKSNLKTLMGLPNRKYISPRSSRMYKVCKMFRDKCTRQARRRLALPISCSPRTLCVQRSSDVDLAAELFESYHQNSNLSPNARRYSSRMKALCLAIQGRSARTYRLIRRVLTLPCSKTLNRIRQSVPLSTGISKVVLDSITKRLHTMSEIDKICVIMFDEMSLAKHLDYDRIQDQILGFQDIAGSRHPTFADHALVFMARGLVSEWKQPVALHLGQAIRKGNLEVVIRETVVALQGIGLKVVAIVSDMAQSNVSALHTLATKTMPERDDPTIKIGNEQIFIFADTPHLLKVLRNNFLKFDVQFKGWDNQIKIAKFSILKEFLEYEKKQRFSEVYPLKLSDRHLDPNSKEKMRVKYAAQLFSYKVSSELKSYAKSENSQEAYDLAEFIEIIDKLFDSFNAFMAPKKDKPLRCSITKDSLHHAFWNDMRESLKDWKFVVRSPGNNRRPVSKCFDFWGKNIISVQSLWRKLRDLGVALKTRNLNQDPLECFFGSVRQQGGCNTNPTSRLFLDIYKILMLNSFSVNLVSDKSNVLGNNVGLLTDLLNSGFVSRENVHSMETFERVGNASTSIASFCSMNKEVEACTEWIGKLSIETTEGVVGFASILSSFLRKHRNYHYISSCFQCFKSIYLCAHPYPSHGKVTCDKCTSLNPSLASEMSKIYVLVLNELKVNAFKSQLSEKLKVCARGISLQDLSCSEHREELYKVILDFIINYAISKFITEVNDILCDTARKANPHK